jgi:uncharacterized protein YxjI
MFTERELKLITSDSFHRYMEDREGRKLYAVEARLFYLKWKIEIQDRHGVMFKFDNFLDHVAREISKW